MTMPAIPGLFILIINDIFRQCSAELGEKSRYKSRHRELLLKPK